MIKIENPLDLKYVLHIKIGAKENVKPKSNLFFMNEKQQKLMQAVGPFQKEGETEISGQIIKIPLGYKGPAKVDPMDYKMVNIQESERDYFPELDGICMLCAVYMTTQKISVPIAFKAQGERSPYKIIL